jgi:hypothetical protein
VKADNRRADEARPYFEKVLAEFKTGEYVEKTQERLKELKIQ